MLKILIFTLLFGFSSARLFQPTGPFSTVSPFQYTTRTIGPWYWQTTTVYDPYWIPTTSAYDPWNQFDTTTESPRMTTNTLPTTSKAFYTDCPVGYTPLNSQKCVKLVKTPMSFTNALSYCQQMPSGYVGSLVSIQNAIDNRALANLAVSLGQTQPVWIGLTCFINSSPYSCQWADNSGSAGSYSNFANGNPFIDVGANAYMLISGGSAGRWVSGDGDLMSIDFFCEATPKKQDTCSNQFNGYCYDIHFTPESNSISSRSTCESQCGDLVSIHSSDENNHILSIFNQFPSSSYHENYLRIGGFTDGIGKYWLDGTAWNYSNLGYFSPQIGSCMSIAVKDDIVPRGSWMSNNCSVQTGFVCKRKKDAKC